MNKRILLALLILISSNIYAQKLASYEFKIKINGIADTTLMLGHHYGSSQYVIDTVPVNHLGEATFKGNDSLPGGIYLVVAPSLKNRYFEMIVSGNESSFTMETDTSDFVGKMKVTGSAENQLFYKDLQFIAAKKNEMAELKIKLEFAGDTGVIAEKIKEEMKLLNENVEQERAKLISENQGLFYGKFLNSISEIKIPEAPLNPDGTKDSTFAIKYVRAHYFDNIDFDDERLLRTNMLEARVKKYFNDYITKIPDSIEIAVDYVLGKAAINKKTFQFITVMLLNDYATSKIMGFDAVYVYIVDKYYSSGRAFWLDDVGLYRIQAQTERVRPTLLGKQAQPLILQDSSGFDIPLYSVNNRFVIVIFWSPDCGHCKKEMPKVEQLYPELKSLGAEVYAVYSEEEIHKWKDWLKLHPYGWINVCNANDKETFQVKYNVTQTPMIYVLDKNKKIIGKKINIEQVPDLLLHQIQLEDAGAH